ncbi:hypothetical protein PMAYCL1PPCAC_09994 [Pristionchus mayeri]|uniref:Transmembrane protein n=1 Tax=Pristionchus mayeri TaxID=1317129 RepID=A0AAN5CED6_9BILA|nr:hypothetical protein PMAYCL1PPCAC_09994 [Pristionchus mayeri]
MFSYAAMVHRSNYGSDRYYGRYSRPAPSNYRTPTNYSQKKRILIVSTFHITSILAASLRVFISLPYRLVLLLPAAILFFYDMTASFCRLIDANQCGKGSLKWFISMSIAIFLVGISIAAVAFALEFQDMKYSIGGFGLTTAGGLMFNVCFVVHRWKKALHERRTKRKPCIREDVLFVTVVALLSSVFLCVDYCRPLSCIPITICFLFFYFYKAYADELRREQKATNCFGTFICIIFQLIIIMVTLRAATGVNVFIPKSGIGPLAMESPEFWSGLTPKWRKNLPELAPFAAMYCVLYFVYYCMDFLVNMDNYSNGEPNVPEQRVVEERRTATSTSKATATSRDKGHVPIRAIPLNFARRPKSMTTRTAQTSSSRPVMVHSTQASFESISETEESIDNPTHVSLMQPD